MWPLRIAVAKLRPYNLEAFTRISIVAALFALSIAGDYLLFRRLFRAIGQVEAATPFFALGLLRNLLALVFMVAVAILFSSALTSAIGAFFTDLDLDLYHASPKSRLSIVMGRWVKTFTQSATMVFVFLLPMFVAFDKQYPRAWPALPATLLTFALLLSLPVSAAALMIILLVRWFPVNRVHQIVASLAIVVLSVAVVGFRMSRPERFFSQITTDDLTKVLKTIELPSMDRYPGTALADAMIRSGGGGTVTVPLSIVLLAGLAFGAFMTLATRIYFNAFVRARESLAPVAFGSSRATIILDRLTAPLSSASRALIGKEVRILSRDVAQWSQLFLMGALLFIYLYNIRMLPLEGDVRATIVAYANVGMAGFVIAAICLRFAYPSVSSEGKAFWLVQTAPVSYRRILLVKVLVYSVPLTLLSLMLTVLADSVMSADRVVWGFTLAGASLLAVTLVSLGVAMGALAPNFNMENPLQVGLSLGGFAYMALSLLYVGAMMLLMARPLMRFVMLRFLGAADESISPLLPVLAAIAMSAALAVIPLRIAERRLTLSVTHDD